MALPLSIHLDINRFEYDFLTDWSGPDGAAKNACYEYCRDMGFCDMHGKVTPKGQAQVKYFKKILDKQ